MHSTQCCSSLIAILYLINLKMLFCVALIPRQRTCLCWAARRCSRSRSLLGGSACLCGRCDPQGRPDHWHTVSAAAAGPDLRQTDTNTHTSHTPQTLLALTQHNQHSRWAQTWWRRTCRWCTPPPYSTWPPRLRYQTSPACRRSCSDPAPADLCGWRHGYTSARVHTDIDALLRHNPKGMKPDRSQWDSSEMWPQNQSCEIEICASSESWLWSLTFWRSYKILKSFSEYSALISKYAQ